MKNKDTDLIKQFNLPNYIKGKSFAEASKAIQKKFEGRNDKASKETQESLMQRLADMQEYVKAQNTPSQQQYVDPTQMQMPGMEMQQPADMEQVQMAEGGMMAGNLLGAGMQTFQLGNQMFNSGIDTSGKSAGPEIKKGAYALQGASTGAQVGSMFGRVGGLVGAGVGSIIGGLGGAKAAKDAAKANQNFDIGQANQINAFKYGGYKNKMALGGNTDPLAPLDPMDNENSNKTTPYNGAVGAGAIFDVLNNSKKGLADMKALNDNGQPMINVDGTTSYQGIGNPQSAYGVNNVSDSTLAISKNAQTDSNNSSSNKKNDFFKKNGDLLRAAPIASDLYQLLSQEKPEVEIRKMTDRKYDPQLIDESRASTDIQSNQANTARALQNASNGSKGFVAANLLGSDLNAARGLGQAAVASQQSNNAQMQYKQQFDMQADQFNIGQDNLAQELTDRNKGQYDSNKSQLIDSLADNVGKVGQEELYKQFPERIGLKFNSKGETMINGKAYTKEEIDNMTPDEKAAILKEIKAKKSQNQFAMGGYQSSFASHMDYLKQ